jgi:hypothetical protein
MRASPSDALGRQLGAASSQPAFWPRTNVTPNGIDPWLQTRPGYGLHQTRPSTTVPKRTRSDEPNALHHDDPRRRPSSSPQKRPLAGRSPAPQMALGEFDRPATAGMSSDHRSIFGAEEDSKGLATRAPVVSSAPAAHEARPSTRPAPLYWTPAPSDGSSTFGWLVSSPAHERCHSRGQQLLRDPSREYYEQLRRPSTRRTVKTTSAQAEYDALEAHKRVHQLEESLAHVDSLRTLSPGHSGYTPRPPIPSPVPLPLPLPLLLPTPSSRAHDDCPFTLMASLISCLT